jgi:succinate dehydrogenase / fumarate reductase, cytochrome b subunit
MWINNYIASSIGKKQLMGVSGLILYGYLFLHLFGNAGLLLGSDHFNSYGHMMLSTMAVVVIPVEIFLMFCLITHITLSIIVTLENRQSRPVKYKRHRLVAKSRRIPGGATTASRTMIYGGIALFLFILLHVLHFKFGVRAPDRIAVVNGVEMRDIFSVATLFFANPWFTAAYLAAFFILGAHLWHGVQSSFQSAGLNHPKYTPFIQLFSKAYALLIGGGFSLIALWAFLRSGGFVP